MKKILLIAVALIIPAAVATSVIAKDNASKETAAAASADATAQDGIYVLRIKDHIFTPDELHVPAGEKFTLIVHNDDPTPEEFESDDFRREKIIAGNSKATIHVGPLKPGKYHFFGEFNLDKANGYLYAEEKPKVEDAPKESE